MPGLTERDGEHTADQLVDRLSKGFDALTAEIKFVAEQRRQLEQKLSWAKEQYLDVLKRYTPDSACQDFRTFLDNVDDAGATEPVAHNDWLAGLINSTTDERKLRGYAIRDALDIRETMRRTRDNGKGPQGGEKKNTDTNDSGVVMERDFTTSGTPGRLRCPFASVARSSAGRPPSTNVQRGSNAPHSTRGSAAGKRSKRPSFHDPIKAEICGNDPASAVASVDESAPLCPIRFLDQHSPEEVAAYFEKHKHELPRSHEICVRRYQSNEQQIRQLDAKYGSLVHMIQGLGLKHQPMLPEKMDDVEVVVEDGVLANDKIKDWAEAISSDDPDNGVSDRAVQDQDRESRFDRPMKEVRLGESPSRPWGIQIPDTYERTTTALSAKADSKTSPLASPKLQHAAPELVRRCPIDHANHDDSSPAMPKQEQPSKPVETDELRPAIKEPVAFKTQKTATVKPQQPSMVFTGPVFIGYSMEQAVQILQHRGA